MTRNPAKLAGPNPMPAPREIRVFTPAELKAVTAELGTVESAAVTFAAATGLRPSEWASIERRDVDKGARWSSCREPRRSGHGARCRSRRRRSGRLTRFPRGWTAATCSRHPVSAQGRASRGRSMSRTSGGANGAGDRSRRDHEAGTLYDHGRRSPRTRSRPESPCSSSPGSWAPARR